MEVNMTTSGAARLKRLGVWMLAATGGWGLTFTLAWAFGLRINTSYSLPMGLYIMADEVDPGDFIEFCPDGVYAEQ
jgi:hypothetical protein